MLELDTPPRLRAESRVLPHKDHAFTNGSRLLRRTPGPTHHSLDMERYPPDTHPNLTQLPDATAAKSNLNRAAPRHSHHQAPAYPASIRGNRVDGGHAHPDHPQDTNSLHLRQQAPSSSNSQDTASTHSTDRIFTPPASESAHSTGNENGQDSSQESQLLQLSQLAAVQEKMPGLDSAAASSAALPRKRMADGFVKHTRERSSASPVYGGGHSRNTSTVSVASTSGSRIGELSAELKARLSYAMVKVNHGWQAHSIDQVETLASQAGSPISSPSTVHDRHGGSASPRPSHRASNNTTPASAVHAHFESSRRHAATSPLLASPPYSSKAVPSLAPPISLQPARQSSTNTRRNSNPRYTPTMLTHYASPQTPGQPSPSQTTPLQRGAATPIVDPILFSPHQNVREQDAIETLLFMSSPNNSSNLKHTFPSSSSQPLPSIRNGNSVTSSPHRTALPGSQPRKSLPSGRPTHHSQPHKRVGFEKSPGGLSDMDIDESFDTPNAAASAYQRGTPRRRANGGHAATDNTPRLRGSLSMSAGLSASSKPRPVLKEDDIEKMLDLAATGESSDSEDEIQIPLRRPGPRSVGI